ncbi:MAG: SDR family NAD(P)-dependent oxidoreductase [Litorimonas sp.]
MRLEGKRAIITGATGGIGRAAVERFLKEGAHVLAVSRSQDKLDALAAEIAHDHLATFRADISDEADTAAYVAEAKSKMGGLDILFANAGTEGTVKPVFEFTVEEFDKIMAVNVRGSWLSIKHAAPAMIESGGGSIIVTSSVAGTVGVPGISPYAASKHAINGLVQVAALELAEAGIRVNSVAPAPIDNAMMRSLENAAAPGAPEAAQEGFTNLIAMKRYGTNDEVANVALFLASDESAFCTGAVYPVDGGFLAA